MNKSHKIILATITFILLLCASLFLYWDRDQEIDFASLLPLEFKHCGKTITENDPDYIELQKWLTANKKGWKNTLASYVPGNTYVAPDISLNLLNNRVVINYKMVSGNWNQVINQNSNNYIFPKCKNSL